MKMKMNFSKMLPLLLISFIFLCLYLIHTHDYNTCIKEHRDCESIKNEKMGYAP
jgi:hypothetical protein